MHDPEGWLWPILERRWPGLFALVSQEQVKGWPRQPLIWVGWHRLEPPPSWLVLRPPALALGMGCNRGTGVDEMKALVRDVLQDQGLSPACLACLASVQSKSDEVGLLELAAHLGLPLNFFSPEELAVVEVPHPSTTVARHMGVASVCEAAALLAANSRRLLVSKHKSLNATLALGLASAPACSTS
ncbi:cobalt-precorrin 5A hydrolase [Desulfarculales bacterium]